MFGCSYLERRTEEKAQKVMRESIKRRVVKFEKLMKELNQPLLLQGRSRFLFSEQQQRRPYLY